MFPRFALATALLVSAFALSACDRLTAENYNKIKTGMSYEEAKGILGAPAECQDVQGMAKHCTWGDEQKNVKMVFIGDKATVFTATNLK